MVQRQQKWDRFGHNNRRDLGSLTIPVSLAKAGYGTSKGSAQRVSPSSSHKPLKEFYRIRLIILQASMRVSGIWFT
jgi:hypothetical protein